MKKKRIITLLLAAVMLSGVLTGCAKGTNPAVLYHDGKKVDVDTIMTVDGYDISLDLYRYYFCNVKNTYDEGDESYWESNLDKETTVLDETITSVKSLVSTIRLAEKLGISLTDEEKEAIGEKIDSTIDSLGRYSSYVSALEGKYMTEDIYRFLLEMDNLNTKMYNQLTGELGELNLTEDEMREIIDNEFMHVQYIYISNETADAQATINEAYEQLIAGGDFAALQAEYSIDTVNTDGYYFGKGYMDEEFEKATQKLNIGETSGVVETSSGYLIIKRLALDEDYIDTNISKMITEHQNVLYSTMLAEIGESLNIEFAPEYSYVGVGTLK